MPPGADIRALVMGLSNPQGTASGAAAAGLAGALVGLGIPEDEAKHYDTEFQSGRTIVTVKASATRYAEAMDILGRNGAVSNRYA